MQLKWTELADSDLEKIEAHITEENSAKAAINVVMNIIDSVELVLPRHPTAGRQGRVKDTRELVVDGIPFVVVYRENQAAGRVEVLRVLHDSQQWPSGQ
ncbi:MAG: type II toxin-antitoxin system RelE/ParE family toxin [Cellvibrionaceae bacterium]